MNTGICELCSSITPPVFTSDDGHSYCLDCTVEHIRERLRGGAIVTIEPPPVEPDIVEAEPPT